MSRYLRILRLIIWDLLHLLILNLLHLLLRLDLFVKSVEMHDFVVRKIGQVLIRQRLVEAPCSRVRVEENRGTEEHESPYSFQEVPVRARV